MSKILLLEDNIFCRKQILEIASKINPKLDFFETSRSSEAYDHSMSNDISAFLLDIQVEDYSGIELAKQLRRIKKYQFTPIIFITAMPTREREAFRQIHCYDYILKPYSEEDIKDVFQRILVDYISEKNIVEEKKLELNSKIIKLKSIKNEVPIGRSFLKEVRGKFNDIY